jgi:hypothetical protein
MVWPELPWPRLLCGLQYFCQTLREKQFHKVPVIKSTFTSTLLCQFTRSLHRTPVRPRMLAECPPCSRPFAAVVSQPTFTWAHCQLTSKLLNLGLTRSPVVTWEGIWKREDLPKRRGELYWISQANCDPPGTWNNNEMNFKVIQEGGTQGRITGT